MKYNLLTNLAEKSRDIGVGEAALFALLGFLVVFVGISFLILIVWLVGRVMSKTTSVGTQNSQEKEVKKQKIETPIQPIESESVSEETVAVIMAALMAYYEKNYPKCEFTVKRIKRI